MPDQNTPFAYSISSLNRIIANVVKTTPALQRILVIGEISNLTMHYSGHWYFSLKDDTSRIKAVMFSRYNHMVDFKIHEGDMVLVSANVDYYGPNGSLQLNVLTMEPYGLGALLAKLQQTIDYYQKKGYFDPSIKKPLPRYPFDIGVITAAASAAQADIHTTLKRRWPLARIHEINTLVQGEGAAAQISDALKRLDGTVDVIIVARGGGSIEDLWAFNDPLLVETIHTMVTPVVSGVGHDSDTTLIDYVADVRANTPTGAVEMVTPLLEDVIAEIDTFQKQLIERLTQRLALTRQQLDHLKMTLSPLLIRHQLDLLAQKLDHYRDGLSIFSNRISNQGQALAVLQQQLVHQMDRLLDTRSNLLVQTSKTLDALSPLKILNRGYSVSLDSFNHPITSIHDIAMDQTIITRFKDGSIQSEVIAISEKE